MGQTTHSFLVDILNILPEKIECFIQAPSLENTVIKGMLQDSDYDYYKLLQLDKTSRNKFIKQALETSFEMYIQNIEIKENGVLLFEGFDGVEYGTISKKILIPEWFKEKYIPDTCMVSSEW